MRVTVNGLAAIVRRVLLRESIMSDLADLVGGEEAERFGRLGSKFKAGGPAAVEGVRIALGEAPSGHDAGWWISRISKARKVGSGDGVLIDALRGYLDALEATTSKRKDRKLTMDSEVISGRFVDPQGRPFELMVPLTHGGSVRCSDRVGGSTWCTASREESGSYEQYAEDYVLFVLGPLLPNPDSGKPEAIQIAADADALHDGRLAADEVKWADQSAAAPSLWWVLESYGLSKQDLVGFYRQHADRIDARRRASSDDPRALVFPHGRINVAGEYRVSKLKPQDIRLDSGITHIEELLLQDSDLTGVSFPRMRYQNVWFDGCDLSNTRFARGTIFVECNFAHCHLEGTVFEGCEMHHVDFMQCSVVGADFTSSRAYAVEFRGSSEFEPVGVESHVFAPGSRWQER